MLLCACSTAAPFSAPPRALRRRAPPRAAAASGPPEEAQLVERVSALVSWCASRGASGDGLEVFPGGSGGRGRGLVASRAISAGETLLCLPLSLGIADEAEGHPASAAKALQRTPWFARLASRLLQEAALGEASAYASYLALLPPRCDASPLLCDDQLAVLRAAYPPLADEAAAMRAEVAAAYAQLSASAPEALAGASAAAFADACSVVYSRAYGLRAAAAGGGGAGVYRLLLPLADMVNHGSAEAPEDGAGPLFPPVRDAANVAWDIEELDGGGYALVVQSLVPLAAGQEALFNYREQSNDHFLLYYGFVPRLNPHDDAVLFDSLPAALAWHGAAFPECAPRADAARSAAAAVAAAVRGGSDAAVLDAEPRLKMLAGTRPDGRLMAALAALHRDPSGNGPAAEAAADRGARAALRRRCAEVLAVMGEDDARGAEVQPAAAALTSKRRILREALAALAD